MLKLPPKVRTGDGDGDEDTWMPSDSEWASLDDPNAPHEVNGVLRMFRNGMTAEKINEAIGLDPGAFVDAMDAGLNEESFAEFIGVPVYDSGIKAGTV